MPTVPDIHRRGTRAAQPAATAVTIGTLYFVTDEGVTERSSGTAWEVYSGSGGGSSGVPLAHAPSHETGGSDPITALAASVLTTGTIAAARLPARIGALGILLDGGGAVLTTGVKGFLEVPFACTITGVTLLSSDPAVLSGSIIVDVWKDSYANYPPTVGDSITASAKPTITSATKSKDTTLTGWTKSLAAGDVLGFSITSVTTLQRVAVSLTVTVP
jgi:hypothetical protein